MHRYPPGVFDNVLRATYDAGHGTTQEDPMSGRGVRTLITFAVMLVGVFAAAWFVGDQLGPEPPREHAGGSMEAHR